MTGTAVCDAPVCSRPAIAERAATLDWQHIAVDLDMHGYAIAGAVLSPAECQGLAESYADCRCRGTTSRAVNSC